MRLWKPNLSYNTGYLIRGVAMLMIIFVHSINESADYESFISRLLMIPHIGEFGCSLFFFMSGYGLLKSYLKTEGKGILYLIKAITKLIIPFFITFIASCLVIKYMRHDLSIDVMNMLILSMPEGTGMWFFKTIIGLYLLFFVLFKISINNRNKLKLLIFFIFFTLPLFYVAHVSCCCYVSNLCFPLGALYGYYENKLKLNYGLLLVLSGVALVVIHFFEIIGIIKAPLIIMQNISFCIAFIIIVGSSSNKSRYIGYIGKESLLYYLFCIPLEFVMYDCGLHYILCFFIKLLCVTFLTYVYCRMRSIVHLHD